MSRTTVTPTEHREEDDRTGRRSMRDCVVPNGRVAGYLPVWFQALTDQPSQKVGWAAIGAVWAALVGAINVVAIVAFGFWALDFVSGSIRAVRDPTDDLRWEKAGDSFLKLGLYVVMYVTGVLADLLIWEASGIHTGGALAGAACAVIISMEIASIRKNIADSMPGAAQFFDRVRGVLENGNQGGGDAGTE